MVKIIIKPNSVKFPELMVKLSSQFTDVSFKMRGKQMMIAKQSSTTGAHIMIRKKKITVAGNFPTMGGTILFVLSMVLLGFLVPLIIYFFVYHKKMKQLEEEIGTFIAEEYQVI